MAHRVPLDPRRVLLDVEAPSWPDLLLLMCRKVLAADGVDARESPEALSARILERDAKAEPNVTEGTTCVHVRVDGAEGVRVCFARTRAPVPDGPGGEAIGLAFLVISPRTRPAFGMHVAEEFRGLCGDPAGHLFLKQEIDAQTLRDWLDLRLHEDESPISAQEIMRAPLGQVGPDIPLPELTRQMVRQSLDCVGIYDDEGRLVGQVRADDIFTMGMPDFFRQLKSVSFISEFDPLERYFNDEKELTARDVMTQDYATVPPDATILEVLFLLSVKRYPKVYVVDGHGVLLGVIDRIRLLDHVLNS